MSTNHDRIDVEGMRRLLAKKSELGAKVRELMQSDGFHILRALFHNFEQDVKNKEDYASLEAFRADRKALEIVRGLLNELESFVNDAEQAADELRKITENGDSTPSLLSLDGEGEDNEDGQ